MKGPPQRDSIRPPCIAGHPLSSHPPSLLPPPSLLLFLFPSPCSLRPLLILPPPASGGHCIAIALHCNRIALQSHCTALSSHCIVIALRCNRVELHFVPETCPLSHPIRSVIRSSSFPCSFPLPCCKIGKPRIHNAWRPRCHETLCMCFIVVFLLF